jgi:glutamyl-tRNA synthetase
VIRGDDHVNNTPRQINVLAALGAQVPRYAHLSMILGDDGQKLSKRRNSVAVTDYADKGYLPEAVLNYLARLGWSHGDDEVFSMAQFVEWFDLDHITASAAQFNTEKLDWLNAQYIKVSDDKRLAAETANRLAVRGIDPEAGPALEAVVALYKDRVNNLNELADAAEPFYVAIEPSAETVAAHLTDPARAALRDLRGRLAGAEWQKAAISQAIKATCAELGIKMPQVAIPLRVALLGQPQSPSIDAVVEVLGRQVVLNRLDSRL